MNKRACRTLVIALSLSLAGAAFADDVDWPYYAADQGGTRYTPADQINRDNFDQLRVIWRYRPRDVQIYETARARARANRSEERGRGRGGWRRGGPRFDNNRGTPLAVNGVLYYGSPFNVLSAVDGQSGGRNSGRSIQSLGGPVPFFVGNSARGELFGPMGKLSGYFWRPRPPICTPSTPRPACPT